MNSRTKSTALKLTLGMLLCLAASLVGVSGCVQPGIVPDLGSTFAQVIEAGMCAQPTSSSGTGAAVMRGLSPLTSVSGEQNAFCTSYGGSISASANNGPECLDINSCYNNPAVTPGTPSKPCPAITFYQAPHENAVGFDTTGANALMSIFYRQPDGNFTAQGFQAPATGNDPTQLRINAVGTPLGTIPQAQRYFTNCRGLTPWAPKPHPAILADQPGTMSRDLIVTSLGGSSPYAEISSNKFAGTISVSLDSQGTLGKSTTSYPVGQTPTRVLTADFNGDGHEDVAVINSGGTPGSVSILLGNGNGTLSPKGAFNVGKGPNEMTSVDFNKDGHADLAVVNLTDNTVTVLIANADGTMKPGVVYSLPGQNPTQAAIVAADFDGDGKADLMVSCSVGLVLLHGNGDGTFQVLTQKTGYSVHYVPLFLTPGDFNKDGKMDLASFNSDGTVAILLNASAGDGSFPTTNRYVAGTPFSAGSNSAGVFAMDFNDDGNLDLVFATGHPDALYANPAFVTLMLGNGDGTFLGPAPAWQVGNYATAMAMADFNGDGRNDLVVTSNPIVGSPGLYILLGAPGGGFQTPTQLSGPVAGDQLVWVTTADLNGDGRLDIIALSGADRSSGFAELQSKVYMWVSNGDGTFQAATSLLVDDGLATFVAAGDVNGDGRADLFLTFGYTGYGLTVENAPPTFAELFTSKPGGGFNAGVMVPLGGSNPIQVALADVNGDGALDLISANHGVDIVASVALATAGNVSVSLGNGKGAFQKPATNSAGANPTWVTAALINGDTKPDLIAGTLTATDPVIVFLAGKGDGTFGAATLTNTYAWPGSVITADFDGDGKQDLAITHIVADAPVTVMRGNGDGTFQPETLVMAGSAPRVAIAADFTGGGGPDLAVLNFTAPNFGTVHLFRNAQGIQPSATHFAVSAPTTSTGIPFNFTVTAVDAGGGMVTTYSGKVHFTSSDSLATLPADATLTNGTGQFTATLKTAGSQTITATDTVNSSVTGTSGTIVLAFPATHFKLFTPATATAGTGFNAALQALDVNNNLVTAYSGTVHFTSSDPAASLPPDTAVSGGLDSFAATLKTGGSQTITATDLAIPSLTGTSTISVTVPALHFSVSAPASATPGTPFAVTVAALTPSNALFAAYFGAVHFTSSDGAAVLPADAKLQNGQATFSATFNSTGSQTITATDTATATITGTSAATTVSPGPHFKMVAPPTAFDGSPISITLTALDSNNNALTSYAGTVHFTSSDLSAALPLNTTLTGGTGTFSVTFNTPGSWTVTARHTVTASMTVTSTVTVGPPISFSFTAPATAMAGTAFNFTVTAVDSNKNVVPGYAGMVQFTSTDVLAGLPVNTRLTNGTGAFSATLNSVGAQTISATDTVSPLIVGTSSAITVGAQGAPPPEPVSVTPSSGSISGGTYTFFFTDPRGYQDINLVNVLVNNFVDGRQACYLAYTKSGSLFLVDDAGDSGGPFAGGLLNTRAGLIQNSQCAVTSVLATGSGNNLTLTVNINWTTAFGGDKIFYMAAQDLSNNNSGWHPKGVLRAPGAVQTTATAVVSATPARGTGQGPTFFTFSVSDTNGFGNVGVVNILINNALDGRQACYLAYSYGPATLYLLDDTGSILGAGSSFPFKGGPLSNSQCTVSWDGGADNFSAGGSNITVGMTIAFKAALTGDLVVYTAAREGNEQNNTGWHAMATWSVN